MLNYILFQSHINEHRSTYERQKRHDLMFGCLTFPATEVQYIRARGRNVEITQN